MAGIVQVREHYVASDQRRKLDRVIGLSNHLDPLLRVGVVHVDPHHPAVGRLVVGEALPDPHMVKVEPLRERAEAADLRFERRLGGPFGYYARFLA